MIRADLAGSTLQDLKGKKLGGSFVAGSFVGALKTLASAGLKPGQDIQSVNLDLPEAVAALQQKIIDAAVIWDPALERVLTRGVGRVLYMSKPAQALGWQGLTDQFLQKNGETGAIRFCKAWATAVWWTSNNAEKATAWFAETSRVDTSILKAAQTADRYLKAPVSDIKEMTFEISDDDINYSQSIIDLLFEQRLAADRLTVADLVDMSFVRKATVEIAAGRHANLAEIKVKA
jgi:ABC-type nitrate/sulfonate/bicarbonate transport system substrate-binding protein